MTKDKVSVETLPNNAQFIHRGRICEFTNDDKNPNSLKRKYRDFLTGKDYRIGNGTPVIDRTNPHNQESKDRAEVDKWYLFEFYTSYLVTCLAYRKPSLHEELFQYYYKIMDAILNNAYISGECFMDTDVNKDRLYDRSRCWFMWDKIAPTTSQASIIFEAVDSVAAYS